MVIGIDLGGMSAKAAVLQSGVLSGKSRVVTSSNVSAEETALSLVKLSMQTAEKAGVKFEQIRAIGIGSPGVIDSYSGAVVFWSNFSWRDVQLAEMVAKYSGKRVFVTNDANAAALGEARYGAGRKYSDSVLITLGTGVGGGIVLGGKLFEGFRSAGAEVGHMVTRAGGELCTCGRRGCYERYASVSALIKMTQRAIQDHPESVMAKTPLDKVDGTTAFNAMKAGDITAQRVVDEYIAGIGEGVINIVNLLRPQAIIIGGGISAEGETLLEPLRRYVHENLYVSENYAPLEILCARLGNDAGLFGAAQYALDRM